MIDYEKEETRNAFRVTVPKVIQSSNPRHLDLSAIGSNRSPSFPTGTDILKHNMSIIKMKCKAEQSHQGKDFPFMFSGLASPSNLSSDRGEEKRGKRSFAWL